MIASAKVPVGTDKCILRAIDQTEGSAWIHAIDSAIMQIEGAVLFLTHQTSIVMQLPSFPTSSLPITASPRQASSPLVVSTNARYSFFVHLLNRI